MKWWVWILFAVAGTLVWFVVVQLLIVFGIASVSAPGRFDAADAYIMGTFLVWMLCIAIPLIRRWGRRRG